MRKSSKSVKALSVDIFNTPGHTLTMKAWSRITLVVAFAIFAVADIINEFVTNDPIGYYFAAPHRLFYVAAIAILGGLITWGYYLLSPHIRQRIMVCSWGIIASSATLFFGYIGYGILSYYSIIGQSGGAKWILLTPPILMIAVIYFWFEFYQAWKTEFHNPQT